MCRRLRYDRAATRRFNNFYVLKLFSLPGPVIVIDRRSVTRHFSISPAQRTYSLSVSDISTVTAAGCRWWWLQLGRHRDRDSWLQAAPRPLSAGNSQLNQVNSAPALSGAASASECRSIMPFASGCPNRHKPARSQGFQIPGDQWTFHGPWTSTRVLFRGDVGKSPAWRSLDAAFRHGHGPAAFSLRAAPRR